MRVGHCDLLIEAPGNGPARDRSGERVGRIRARAVTEHVARELVEYDDESESAFGPFFPSAQPARRCVLVGRRKPFPDLRIEVRVGLEPALVAGSEPERENVLGGLPRLRVLFTHALTQFTASAQANIQKFCSIASRKNFGSSAMSPAP